MKVSSGRLVGAQGSANGQKLVPQKLTVAAASGLLQNTWRDAHPNLRNVTIESLSLKQTTGDILEGSGLIRENFAGSSNGNFFSYLSVFLSGYGIVGVDPTPENSNTLR